MKKVLVVDNYDSFTYNLVQMLTELGAEVTVVRNDRFELEQVSQFDKVLLSPGPGIPSEAGLMPELVRRFASSKPILGVCLGHQCIGEVFGAKLINMSDVVHGKGVPVVVADPVDDLFAGLPKSFIGGRYHSWLVSKENLPDALRVTAVDERGDIMALRHREYDLKGVQFHPESVLTEHGREIIRNWLK